MKFFGITRFNLVTSKTLGSFRSTKNKTLEAAKRELYEENNLRVRLELFKSFCLPTYKMLARQSINSYGLILINKDFPEKFKYELIDLCLTVPRLSVIELNDQQGIIEVIKPLIQSMGGNEKIFTYRYDDDDALSIDFLEQIERNCLLADINTVISFNDGYCLSRINKDSYNLYVRKYPLNAFGLGIVSDLNDFKIIFELGSHTQIKLPTIHIKDVLGWLCTVHADNDSRVGKRRLEIESKDSVIKAINEKFPHIEKDILSNLTFRRDEDNNFNIQTAHRKYLAYNLDENKIIQVDFFNGETNILPIFIDKFTLNLSVTVNSEKIILRKIYGDDIFLQKDRVSENEFIIQIQGNKFAIKINDFYLSARKPEENVEFNLQKNCKAWELFSIV